MRVLHVVTSLDVGGTQRLLTDLIPGISNCCHADLLVYLDIENGFKRTLLEKGIRIIDIDEPDFGSFGVVFKLRRIFRNYDIVHVHLFPSLYQCALAAIGLRTKMVYTEHSTSNRRRNKFWLRPVERFIYSRYERIISISKDTENALTSWLGYGGERFVTINNGVDISRFNSIEVPRVENALVMVSRFAPAKDQETVIRAIPYVRNEVFVRFVGDGVTRQKCERLSAELGVSDRVQFWGSRSDVAELISSSLIGVQSSKWEGFGLTAVEMMACGKPVIASNVDGLRQVVDGAGLLFEVGDEKQLADLVNKLYSDRAFYETIAARCRQRAESFDISLMADKYLAVYKTLFNNRDI